MVKLAAEHSKLCVCVCV